MVTTSTPPISDYADFLSIPEAAARLAVHPNTVRDWINKGQLPAIRVGVRFRVRREDLDGMVRVA